MSVSGEQVNHGKKRTILVVDDSAYARRMIRFALVPYPRYELIEALDGADALAKFDGNRIDLVITDLNMSGMDGFELIRAIRRRPEGELLPIIMLTGEVSEANRELARAAGVSTLIFKPFVPEQISGLVEAIFN